MERNFKGIRTKKSDVKLIVTFAFQSTSAYLKKLGAPSHLLPPLPYPVAHNINVVEGAELRAGGAKPCSQRMTTNMMNNNLLQSPPAISKTLSYKRTKVKEVVPQHIRRKRSCWKCRSI